MTNEFEDDGEYQFEYLKEPDDGKWSYEILTLEHLTNEIIPCGYEGLERRLDWFPVLYYRLPDKPPYKLTTRAQEVLVEFLEWVLESPHLGFHKQKSLVMLASCRIIEIMDAQHHEMAREAKERLENPDMTVIAIEDF